jgi:hypothetical protein
MRRFRIWGAVVVAVATAALSLAGLLVASASPAVAASDPAQDMLARTNQARADAGLGPLQWDGAAANVARAWTQNMANTGVLAHNPNLVSQINGSVTNQWSRIGENVGYGGDTATLQNAFMNSPGHRANIMGDYNRLGVGAVYDGAGRLWLTLDFVKGPDLGPPPGGPFGQLDNAVQVANGIRVLGWTIDPDTAAPIQVHVYVDSAGTNTGNAATQRSDIGRAFPDYGGAHGFDTVVGAGPGWHNVCAYGINVGGGTNTLLGCRAVLVNPNPFGQLDQVVQVLGGLRVSGWAIDPETAAPIQVHIYVDAGGTNLGYADDSRPDVGSHFGYARYGNLHGFNGVVGAGPGPHWVCAYAINTLYGANSLIGCRSVIVNPNPFGSLDDADATRGGVHVSGWDIDPDTSSPIQVHVYIDGGGTNLGPAANVRKDVGSVFAFAGYGANHGFDATIPAGSGRHQVCAYAINVAMGANTSLGCKTVTVG